MVRHLPKGKLGFLDSIQQLENTRKTVIILDVPHITSRSSEIMSQAPTGCLPRKHESNLHTYLA